MTTLPASEPAERFLAFTLPWGREQSSRFWLWATFVLAAAHFIVFVSLPIPPLHDYLGHLARVHIMDAQGHSAFIDRYYDYDWSLHSNFGGDLIIYSLAQVMPIEMAGRITVAAIPALTIVAVALVRREVFGRVDSMVLLSTPFALGPWFSWGFVNFTLAVALVLLAFVVWLRVRQRSLPLRMAALFASGFVVCVSHLVGWGVLGLLVFSWELVAAGARLTSFRSIVRAMPAALLAVAPLLLVPLTMLGGAGAEGARPYFYADNHWATKIDAPFTALAFTWDRLDKYCVMLIGAVCAAAIAFRLAEISRGLLLASGLVLLAFLVCPTELLGAANADIRLLTPLALIATTAMTWRKQPAPAWLPLMISGLALVAIGLSLGRFAYTSATVIASQEDVVDNARHVELLPQGARVLVFVADFSAGGRPPIAYTPALAVIRRNAFSNEQWERNGGHPLTLTYLHELPKFGVREGMLLKPYEPGVSDPLAEAVAKAPIDRFDYVWVVHSHRSPPLADVRLEAISQASRSTLYRVIAPQADPKAPETAAVKGR